MPTEPLHEIDGHISIVQEERFCLIADDGRGLRFTLGRQANVDGPQLQRLRAGRVRVRVGYSGEPTLASAVAKAVRPLPSHAAAP